MRSLYAPRPAPYYIYAYDYRRTSAGVRIMHMLADTLNRSGHEAYVVANTVSPDLLTPRLTMDVVNLHRTLNIEPIMVYAEVAEGNPLNGNVVVRYLLNKPGFLFGSGQYGADDILFAFAKELIQDGMPEDQWLHLPALDLQIFQPPVDPATRVAGRTCYYQGRDGAARIDPALLSPDAIEITQLFPSSWEELAGIFQSCETFYSGTASALCAEAVLCGCLAVVIPSEWAPDPIARDTTGSYGCAWGMDAEELARAKRTLPQARERYRQLEVQFWKQLDHFIDVTQAAAKRFQHERRHNLAIALGSPLAPLPLASLRLRRLNAIEDTRHYRANMVVQTPVRREDEAAVLGVVLHVTDLTLCQEILVSLGQLGQPLHLYVSCQDRLLLSVAYLLQESELPHSLMRADPRGRDLLPFLKVLPLLQEDGIHNLLKLHTDLEQGRTAEQLRERIAGLAFGEGARQAVVRLERAEAHVLASQAAHSRLSVMQQVGEARSSMLALATRAGLSEGSVLSSDFIVDGMFYARLEALACLEDLHLRDEEFEDDDVAYGGSFTRALTMFLSVLVEARNGSDLALSYHCWLERRSFAEERFPALQGRVDSWARQATLLVVILDPHGQVEEVKRTLSQLQEQLYGAAAIVVLSSATPDGVAAADNLLWQSIEGSWLDQLNALVAQIEVDWIYLLGAGDELEPHSLLLLAERIDAFDQWTVCYSDEDSRLGDVYQAPVFKPDFNLDLLRSYPYIGGTLAFARQALLEVGGFDGRFAGLAPVNAAWRLVEAHGVGTLGHIDEIMVHKRESLGEWLVRADVAPYIAAVTRAHLGRLGIAHEVRRGVIDVINRVHYRHATLPRVSIVIPTKDQLRLLRRCVESLVEVTRYPNYELLIVDNNSEQADTKAWLARMAERGGENIRVVRYSHPFNYSAINNTAIAQARGEYVVLLNNDTAVNQADWIEAMLNHAQRPEVGIVGAKLLYPDGRIQHGGVVLGLRGPADHPFAGEEANAPGYMHRLHVDQNYSAVTAACLMIRKAVYDEVGGMDEERFKVSFNDVDLCLKVGAAGYLTVWTPYAVLLHEGNASQNTVDTTAFDTKVVRFQSEQALMYESWLPKIARDPAYNKNLVLEGTGFAFSSTSLTPWYPFVQRAQPYVLCHQADPYGCGHYRVLKPLQAMQNAQLLEGAATEMLLTPVETERLSPDSIVFQRQLSELQLSVLRNTRRFSKAFKVYELDDYIVDLPHKSLHRSQMPKDVVEQLGKAVGLCDRLVVSTPALANALSHLHTNIRVVENRLPTDWWHGLQGRRRAGHKPRVGWAGGSSHSGDLELLFEVVRSLSAEVEWVFMGMCLEEIRPYLHEFHAGVPIDSYPAKLASLDLDLALAPLEFNLFNECKSNLRLLEYGACGFPVICTDIECYRGGLPVTLVGNRPEDWITAIRAHLSDLDATARLGDALREAVLRDWMLEGEHLARWKQAWLAD